MTAGRHLHDMHAALHLVAHSPLLQEPTPPSIGSSSSDLSAYRQSSCFGTDIREGKDRELFVWLLLSVISDEELAFVTVHPAELSPKVLRQLGQDIVAEKRKREAEAPAKAEGLGEGLTGQACGRHPDSASEETSVSRSVLRVTAGKRKAIELGSSESGSSLEPATRRPALGPLSGTEYTSQPAHSKGISAQDPVG
jgi:hypothetical protein